MTIARAFAEYLTDEAVATYDTDLSIGSAPTTPDAYWWIIARGGSPQVRAKTGEMAKQYLLDVFYRDRDGETVDETLQALEENLNQAGCIELDGFNVIEVAAQGFASDQDLDDQDRRVGVIQVSILTYKEA